MSVPRSFTVPRMLGVLCAALVLIIPMAMFAGPAQADIGTRWQNWANGYCLDSNHAGDVYTKPCQEGNNFQTWDVSHFYADSWIVKNRATGRCLTAWWPNDKIVVRTGACDNPTPQWEIPGDWKNTHLMTGLNFKFCLDSAGHNDPQYPAEGAPGGGGYTANCNYGTYQTWRSI